MIEVVSKNGCYMLNVGPKPDGTICDEEKNVLLEIGKWMNINGEAIYGSYPYEICASEGKKSKNGTFKENKNSRQRTFALLQKKESCISSLWEANYLKR